MCNGGALKVEGNSVRVRIGAEHRHIYNRHFNENSSDALYWMGTIANVCQYPEENFWTPCERGVLGMVECNMFQPGIESSSEMKSWFQKEKWSADHFADIILGPQ